MPTFTAVLLTLVSHPWLALKGLTVRGWKNWVSACAPQPANSNLSGFWVFCHILWEGLLAKMGIMISFNGSGDLLF